MPSFQDDPIVSLSSSASSAAVQGESKGFEGVRGVSHNEHGAVVGINDYSPSSPPGAGGNGGWFESSQGEGVRGWSKTLHHGGVVGVNTAGGFGVYGKSDGSGVVGESTGAGGVGVVGISDAGTGILAKSQRGEAMHVESSSDKAAALAAYNIGSGPALFAKAGTAARFEGNVTVTGNIEVEGDVVLVGNHTADYAEDFDVVPGVTVDPGTVMILDDSGALRPSEGTYDRRVAGVISGAGDYRPGIVLDKQARTQGRMPLALVGKVFCKVDASQGPIAVGDLLTTSATPGHAMAAADPARALGAIIGKALQPVTRGQGLIPILVALQ